MKTIVLQPAAARALDKLTMSARSQVLEVLHTYATTGNGDAKALTGTSTIRLRSGDFRIIFDETAQVITVLALGNRREIYR